MISPFDVATGGYFSGPLSVAVDGYLYVAVVEDNNGSRRTIRAQSEERLRRQIRDEEEIISFIVMAISEGII